MSRENRLRELLGKKVLVLDGGTGTVLQTFGIKPGELSENWNLSHPDKIVELHYNYFKAGSNIVLTNSFGAYDSKFALNLEKVICAAIKNADDARKKIESEQAENKDHFIAYDMSSCGKLLKPMGDLDFEDAVKLFKKTAVIAAKQNIDCFYIETMNDGYETKACIIAVKEAMEEAGINLPIFVTNVYDTECRTLSGSTPECMVTMLEGLGVEALGLNCSLGPLEMMESVERLIKIASVPVIVKPNAGLPKVADGKTVFDVDADDFVKAMNKILKMGAGLVGGCCGTNPQYIKKLSDLINSEGYLPLSKEKRTKTETVISSNSKVVYFGHKYKPVLIGERINPTGKKKFKEALRNNDIPYIIHQGIEQDQAGADVLDVNVGLPEIDENEMMTKVMTELQAVTELPLQIDTTDVKVMESALRRYNGKPLINSVNGKQEVMKEIFPLAKKYGGVIIGLTLDEDGIPEASEKRIEIAKKIYAEAEKYGICKKDIIIDPLAMAVSSDSKAGIATLETVKAIHEMGGNTSLGISNVSFGLPDREFVTSAFFTMCLTNGLSAAIMNPLQFEMMKAYKTFCLLMGKDENCTDYIAWTEKNPVQAAGAGLSITSQNSEKMGVKDMKQTSSGDRPAAPQSPLSYAVIHGLKEDAAKCTRELLTTTDSLEIINGHLIPGLDYVGKRFEEKTMYLPQLLMAAEAAKSAFTEIKAFLEASGKKGTSKGKIIIATVKGDIHDIGKNIVKVLLENYDFTVIDLGKDVAPGIIVEACKKDKVQLVGLSALMTTTVPAMEETIKQLKKECPWAKVCAGGAVLTQEYADMIHADFYGKDAMDTVRYAEKIFAK